MVASFGSRAEHSLHAIRLSTMVVEKFVQDHKRWPTSWEELETVSADDGIIYSWPVDSPEIQSYVQIDFNLTLKEVECKKPDRFDTIKPVYPTWQSYRDYTISLIETVKKERKQTKAPGARSKRENEPELS